jgi:phosphate:Na+ symporter
VVVNFHTGFNLALGVVCILLIGPVARLCGRLLPDRPVELDPGRPRHLDRTTLDTPSLALACAARESLRMGDVVETMLRDTLDVLGRGDPQKLAWMGKLDDTVDKLHEVIKLFVTDVSREPLSPDESRRAAEILSFTTNLEHIGDIIDKNLLELAQKKIRNRLSFSDEGWNELETMHSRVVDNMQLALGVYMTGDVDPARQLLAQKDSMRNLERAGSEHHLERLRSGRVQSIETSALHLDIMRDLKRINSHLTSVAYPILDAHGELRKSRLRPLPPPEPASDAPADSAETRPVAGG